MAATSSRNGEEVISANFKTLAVKTACRASTTANITLSGTQTIDGVAVVALDRVLAKNQTDQTQNGVYIVQSGAWLRADDSNEDTFLVSGALIFVTSGTTNAGTLWIMTAAGTITIGTTNITFAQIGAGGLASGAIAVDLGDGSDGAVTITGSSALTRDMYYSSLTVNNGGILSVGGFRIYCTGTVTVNSGGVIQGNATVGTGGGDGAAGSGGTAGQGGTSAGGSVPPGTGGGAGGLGGLSGAGGDAVNGTAPTAYCIAAAAGGDGAIGGSNSGFAGGGKGTGGAVSSTFLVRTKTMIFIIKGSTFLTAGLGGGGGGGGAGAANGGGGGGGGGSGGPVVWISANSIVNNGTIKADGAAGGNGGNGNAGSATGGGSGGGGGGAGLVYEQSGAFSGSGITSANGGNGGNGGNHGGSGGNPGSGGKGGPGGGVLQIRLDTGTITYTAGSAGSDGSGGA